MENETWYCIAPNYEVIKIEAPQEYNLPLYCWLRATHVDSNTTSFGNTYHIFKYEFFDKNFEKFTVQFGGWQLINVVDPPLKNIFNNSFCEISDKYGAIQRFHQLPVQSEGYLTWNAIFPPDGIGKVIEYISTVLAGFDDLPQFLQHIKILELNQKLANKTSQIDRLEKTNEKLRKSLSYIIGTENVQKIIKETEDLEVDNDILNGMLKGYIKKLNKIRDNMTP